MSLKSCIALIGLAFAWIALAGCASIDGSDYRQTVLVTSNPAGAKIYEGDRYLGMTPAFVRVRRGRRPELRLQMPGQSDQVLDLNTHYRWVDSFAANFVMLIYAPIGWVADWATGTAWKMDDPAKAAFVGAKAPRPSTPTVAIAPPVGDDAEITEALGSVLEARLGRDTKYHILSYDQTAPLFSYYSSDQGLTDKANLRHDLFYELKADRVLTSRFTHDGDGYEVKSKLIDVYDGRDEGDYRWEVEPQSPALREDVSSHNYYAKYFHILPNTVFVNFSAFQTGLTIDGTDYYGVNVRGSGFTDRIWDYLSSVSFAHMDRPRSNVKGHFVFNFVPTAIISRKDIAFNNYRPLQNTQFQRWYVAAGYGAEVGHMSRAGFFYFDLIPMATWTRLAFHTTDFDESISRTSVTLMYELGYSYFFSNHFVAKLYARGLTEDTSVWERAIHDVTGQDSSVSSPISSFVGLAIGYYIPSSLKDRSKGWRVTNESPK